MKDGSKGAAPRNIVAIVCFALILGAFVFIVSSPGAMGVLASPHARFGPGDVIHTENTTWIVQEYMGYHARPKYRVVDRRDGRPSIIDVDWADRVGTLVEAR